MADLIIDTRQSRKVRGPMRCMRWIIIALLWMTTSCTYEIATSTAIEYAVASATIRGAVGTVRMQSQHGADHLFILGNQCRNTLARGELAQGHERRPPEVVAEERKEFEKNLAAANPEGLSIFHLIVTSLTKPVQQWLEAQDLRMLW